MFITLIVVSRRDVPLLVIYSRKYLIGLLWILNNIFKVYNEVKVLDDFLFLAPTSSSCSRSLNIFRSLCARIRVPLAERKTEGPVTCITFLGIEIDSDKMVARLVIDKLKAYSSDISQLLQQR